MVKALFAGSFDPITYGHLDIIKSAGEMFDELIVAVGKNDAKKPLFSLTEREELINQTLAKDYFDIYRKVTVITFDGLLADVANEYGINILVRGIRDSSDCNYELQMAGINQQLNNNITTIFIPVLGEAKYVSSSAVKQIASMGGDVSAFVPNLVIEALHNKYTI